MSRRLLMLSAMLVVGLGVVLWLPARGDSPSSQDTLRDFVEYWAAARLLWHGENPYDLARVGELERQAGRTEEPLPMLNPPFVIPLFLPYGLPPPRIAHILWLLTHLAVLLFVADALYGHYGGPAEYRLVAIGAGLLFGPSISSLLIGQISPWLLLGAWAFLALIRQRRDLLAGMVTILLAIKPHLCYLFWIAVLLWTVRTGRWRVIAGGILAGLLLTGVALLFNPNVITHYLESLKTPPQQYESPVLGTLLRQWQGGAKGILAAPFAWQYVPMLFGLGWLAGAWPRLQSQSWDDTLPQLLLMSLVTAPYGAWLFDLVLLVVPLSHLMALVFREKYGLIFSVSLYVGLCGVLLGQMLRGGRYMDYIWLTPMILCLYVAGLTLIPSPTPPLSSDESPR